jgi:two-component system chemotaxis response regulator CheB
MTPRSLIRVLVIDDSAFSRQAITRMLDASPLVEVVGVARDGEEALRKAFDLQPDLITVDLEMPRMDGFTFLRVIMSKRPTPVIVVSGRAGEEEVFRALELGAVDFVGKPSPRATPELNNIEQELVRKVHAVRDLRIDRVRKRIDAVPAVIEKESGLPRLAPRVVVIGSSTGGPAALMHIFGAFPDAPQCSFVVAQHMPAGFTRGFAERIDRMTQLRAIEAEGGEALSPGTVLIAPGGKHLGFESTQGGVVTKLIAADDRDKYTPSVDRLFESAAKHVGTDLLAVVLTGMGDDGRSGVRSVNQVGGSVIAESESTAVIFGMPQQAIRTGFVDQILPLGEIAAAIQVGNRSISRRGQDHEGMT